RSLRFAGPRAHRLRQKAQFLIDLRRVGHGRPDFGAEKLAITLAQTLYGALEGRLGDAKRSGKLGVADLRRAGEIAFQAVKLVGPAILPEFRAKLQQYAIEQGAGPLALEDALRRLLVPRFAKVGGFAMLEID